MKSEQAAWDAYRVHPDHKPLLDSFGLSGCDDLDEALDSKLWVLAPEDDLEFDGESAGGITLGAHVLHTLSAFSHKREQR